MFTFILANLFRCYSLLTADYWKKVLSTSASRVVPYFLVPHSAEKDASPPKVFHPVAPHLSAAVASTIFQQSYQDESS